MLLHREFKGQPKVKWYVILALPFAQRLLCNFQFFLQKNATACKNSEELKKNICVLAQGRLNTFHIWEWVPIGKIHQTCDLVQLFAFYATFFANLVPINKNGGNDFSSPYVWLDLF